MARSAGHTRSASGLTLIELLVTIAIIAMLIAIVLPAMGKSREAAKAVLCQSGVRQMGLALTMYCDDNRERLFPQLVTVSGIGDYWWFGFEAEGGPTVEGQRILDRSQGRLWRYYTRTDSIEVCPSFPLASPKYKPKFTTNWTTYAIPLLLVNPASPSRRDRMARPADTLAFADSAQVNTFQSPASPSNPMFEQWHTISQFHAGVLYHHGRIANAVMFDGHVRALEPAFGVALLFPEAPLGRPPADVLLTAP